MTIVRSSSETQSDDSQQNMLAVEEQAPAKLSADSRRRQRHEQQLQGIIHSQFRPSGSASMSPLVRTPHLATFVDNIRRVEINKRFNARMELADRIYRARRIRKNNEVINGQTDQEQADLDRVPENEPHKRSSRGKSVSTWLQGKRKLILKLKRIFNFIRGHENLSYLDVDNDKLAIQERESVESFIVDLGSLLAVYGCSMQILEYHATVIAASYGMHCKCSTTGTGIMFAFSDVLVPPPDLESGIVPNLGVRQGPPEPIVETESRGNLQWQQPGRHPESQQDQQPANHDGGIILQDDTSMPDFGFTSIHMSRTGHPIVDQRKLCMLTQIADNVSTGKLTIDTARSKMQKVVNYHPFFHHSLLVMIIGVLMSVSFSVVTDRNLIEMLSVVLSNLLISPLYAASEKVPVLAKISMALFSLISAATAIACKYFFLEKHFVSVPMVAFVSAMPFIRTSSFTTGITEISGRAYTLSGTSKILEMAVSVIQLIFMASIASNLDRITFPDIYSTSTQNIWRHHDLSYIAAILVGSLGFSILHRKPKDILTTVWLVVSCFVSFYGTQLLSLLIGVSLASLMTATVVAIFSNVYSRISRHPPVLVTSAAILFIFSGAVTASYDLAGLLHYSGLDTTSSIVIISRYVFVLIAITLGIVTGNLFVPLGKKIIV